MLEPRPSSPQISPWGQVLALPLTQACVTLNESLFESLFVFEPPFPHL